MSLIDSTFKTLPEQILNQFGIDVTYIKTATTQYTEAGTTKVARIVDVKTQRGDSPILHTVLGRPQ